MAVGFKRNVPGRLMLLFPFFSLLHGCYRVGSNYWGCEEECVFDFVCAVCKDIRRVLKAWHVHCESKVGRQFALSEWG